MQWPEQGVPDNPRGWLIQVAARRMTDHLRRELARRRRETVVVMQVPGGGGRTTSIPERNYLTTQAARLRDR